MRNTFLLRKSLICVLLIFFIGTSFIPNICGVTGKLSGSSDMKDKGMLKEFKASAFDESRIISPMLTIHDRLYIKGNKHQNWDYPTTTLDNVDTVYVDDNYCPTCYNDGHQWRYDAFDNIQDGINAASLTVLVYYGEYNESIKINKQLHIKGNGTGDDNDTIINGIGGKATVYIDADGIVFTNFTITTKNGQTGIVVSPGSDNVRIERCNISCEQKGYYGIHIERTQHTVIIKNILSGSSDSFNGIHLLDSSYCIILDSIITKFGFHGIEISGGRENEVNSTELLGNNKTGIYLSYTKSNKIIHCDLYDNIFAGIDFTGCYRGNTAVNYCNFDRNYWAMSAAFTYVDAEHNFWGRSSGPGWMGLRGGEPIVWTLFCGGIYYQNWETSKVQHPEVP